MIQISKINEGFRDMFLKAIDLVQKALGTINFDLDP